MKVVSALLGMALVVVGGMAVHFSRVIAVERQQIAGLKAQLQERDARIATLADRPAAPPAIPAADIVQQTGTPDAAASPPPAASLPPANAAALQGLLTTMREQSSSPEAMAQRRRTTRYTIEAVNPDIGEALGLSPDEADKLLELLVTHQENSSAVFRSTIDGNSTTTVQERSAILQAQREANDAELQARLGNKYSQWKDYNDTRTAWQQRRDLRAVLDAGGIPMTDAQSKSLIAALAAEQRNITQRIREAVSQGRSISETRARYTPELRQRSLDAASPHLTPQQLEGYRGLLEREAAQERYRIPTWQAADAQAAAAASSR